jgi:hypothetical protein
MPGIYLPVGAGILLDFCEDFAMAWIDVSEVAYEWIGGDKT